MTYKTKGIVLRSIKYGETSLVVTIFTELFGVQTYMVNGIRTAKKSGAKVAMYQPSAILDLEVYHNEQKSMHRIKEANWAFLYQQILSNVVRNSIAVYMAELLYKALKQPEPNPNLFYFCEHALEQLDSVPNDVAANFPLYFSLHLPYFFGFRINGEESSEHQIVDLVEGSFTDILPNHPHFLDGEKAIAVAKILQVMQPQELSQIKLHQQQRREILLKLQEYYSLHIQDFGQLKTLEVLQELFS